MSLQKEAERLESEEVLELDEIFFEDSGHFSHTGLKVTGSGSVGSKEYDLRLSYGGSDIVIRASSDGEVYLGRVDENVESLDEFEDYFQDIVENAELKIAYRN